MQALARDATSATAQTGPTDGAQTGEQPRQNDTAPQPAPPQHEWEFDAALYLWAAGIDGTVGTSSVGVPINESFSDLLSNLAIGGMLNLQGREEHWGFAADFVSMKLDGVGAGLTGNIDVEVETIVGEADLTYSPPGARSLQFLAGARVTYFDVGLSFPTLPKASGSTTIVDPVLGAAGNWDLGEHFHFRLRGDFGGFGVGSELTYQALGYFGWKFAEDWRLDFGYRLLGYDIKSGGVNVDTQIHGLVLGVGYSF